MVKILFVCTGNTCRSPMAEALLRSKGRQDFEVRSAGVSAVDGAPAASAALEVLGNKGISLKHQAKKIDRKIVQWADLILTMAEHHKLLLKEWFPVKAGQVHTLKEYVIGREKDDKTIVDEWTAKDIEDPFGGEIAKYSQVCQEIEELIDRLIEKKGTEN